jgi:hypothetical protein
VVLLISSDGLCYEYQYKVPLLHIRRLIASADTNILLITSSCG